MTDEEHASAIKKQLHSTAYAPIEKTFLESRSQDKVLLSVGLAVLVAYVAFPSITQFKIPELKWVFLVAFITTLMGELFILWRYVRFPSRLAVFESKSKATADKTGEIIKTIMQAYVLPLTRYDEREQIDKIINNAKDENEARVLIEQRAKDIDKKGVFEWSTDDELRKKADKYMTMLEVMVMSRGIEIDAEESFKEPLNEKNSRIKHQIDTIAELLGKQLLYFGITATIMGVALDILSK